MKLKRRQHYLVLIWSKVPSFGNFSSSFSNRSAFGVVSPTCFSAYLHQPTPGKFLLLISWMKFSFLFSCATLLFSFRTFKCSGMSKARGAFILVELIAPLSWICIQYVNNSFYSPLPSSRMSITILVKAAAKKFSGLMKARAPSFTCANWMPGAGFFGFGFWFGPHPEGGAETYWPMNEDVIGANTRLINLQSWLGYTVYYTY